MIKNKKTKTQKLKISFVHNVSAKQPVLIKD